ncbi:MAG: SDR family NAD(P)-dependent oxidoreductase [Myxococcota bacterium]
MNHPAIAEAKVAVITGGASGIGLAAAMALSKRGMRICLADLEQTALERATKLVGGDTFGAVTDVARRESVDALRDMVFERFGQVDLLLNNAGTAGGSPKTFSGPDHWDRIIGVNLWGVVHGLQSFVPRMVKQGTPGAVINTGSKQGLTNPPGNAAYNASKAAVRTITESLAHELRNIEGCKLTAHLLIPGFTYTGMVARAMPERPPAAWTPEQVVERLLESLSRGEFYVICPDNEVTTAIDHARMQWNLDDIIHNRPALSRWHPEFQDTFTRFMKA